MASVLELAGVTKRYGRGPLVLDGVSLALEAGTLTQVRGGNGSGKSTLLRVACGFSRPTAGRVSRNWTNLGFVPDRALPPVRMTARGYLDQVGRLAGLRPSAITAAGDALAERLGLAPGLDAPLGTLSRGNQRKVLLSQALLRPAELVVLDEPFTALDLAAAEVLGGLLRERVSQGSAVLVALHGDELGDAGRALTLEAGTVVADPSPQMAAGPGRLVAVELSGPQPEWTSPGEPTPDGCTCYVVGEADVERLLAAALTAGARVRRVDSSDPRAER